MAPIVRELRISTDGAQVSIDFCQLTPLELNAVCSMLLEALRAGALVLPQGIPILALPEKETPIVVEPTRGS